MRTFLAQPARRDLGTGFALGNGCPMPANPPEHSRASILEAARLVVAQRGAYETHIRHLLTSAGVSRTTFYAYFPGGKQEVLRDLAFEVQAAAVAAFPVLAKIDDPAARLVAMTRWGFDMVERYGVFSTELAAGIVPVYCRNVVPVDLVYRFIGRAIKECESAGYCKPAVDTRLATHVYFALVHPDHVRRRIFEGKAPDEILEETMTVFFAAFAQDAPDIV